jgi:hypothetical protein
MQLCAVEGWTMPCARGKAATSGVMQVRLSEVKRRWPVGGSMRDDVKEARGAAEVSDSADHRPAEVAFPVAGFARFADDAKFAEGDSLAMTARRAQST